MSFNTFHLNKKRRQLRLVECQRIMKDARYGIATIDLDKNYLINIDDERQVTIKPDGMIRSYTYGKMCFSEFDKIPDLWVSRIDDQLAKVASHESVRDTRND